MITEQNILDKLKIGLEQFGSYNYHDNGTFEFEMLQEAEEVEILNVVLKTLPPRHQKAVRYRFGLNGKKPETLRKVGERLGVTQERVRQIIAKALRMLRHPLRIIVLKEILNT